MRLSRRHALLFPFSLMLVAQRLEAASTGIPGELLREEHIKFQFAIFYPVAPKSDPVATVKTASQQWHDLAWSVHAPFKPTTLTVTAVINTQVKVKAEPPGPEVLAQSGYGLDDAQKQAMQGAKHVLFLNFNHPARLALDGLRTANALAEQVARSTDGILWDPTTREAFSADAWHERRVEGWDEDMPEAAKQIAVFGTRRDGRVRAVTAGMAKFGVPDLVVDSYPPAMHGQVRRMLGLIAQALAEGAAVGKRGEMVLDVAGIRHSRVRQRARAGGVAAVTLLVGLGERADLLNRTVEIAHPDGLEVILDSLLVKTP